MKLKILAVSAAIGAVLKAAATSGMRLIPDTAAGAGFFGKYMIFVGALDAGLQPLAYVLAASSAVSVYYYLAIVRATWIEEEGVAATPKSSLSPGLALTCIICAAGILGAMVFANPLMKALDIPNDSLIEHKEDDPFGGTFAITPVQAIEE